MHTGRHGVPREVIDAHFKASEEFFALPPEKKMLKVPNLLCTLCIHPHKPASPTCNLQHRRDVHQRDASAPLGTAAFDVSMQGVDGQGYQTLDLNDCRLKADDASVAADFVGDTLKTTMERFALAGESTAPSSMTASRERRLNSPLN